jgi:nitrogen fixation NifU-like protein
MLTEAVQGLTMDQVRALSDAVRSMMHGERPPSELGDLRALQGVSKFPVRVKCALLPWQALEDALSKETTRQ